LRDGDSCALGPRARFRFSLPSSLSTTAILELDGGARLDGDVRRVILLDRHLILGADAGAHIKIPRLADRVILSATPEGFRLKTRETVEVNGEPRDAAATLPPGAHIQA